MTVKILNEKPPEWIMQGCMNAFRIDIDSTFWTYGDTIYNPGGRVLPDHIIAHEKTHMRQQETCEGGKDAWWKEYLANPRFRLEQEAEAYAAQYRFFCEQVRDRNARALILDRICTSFSGPLYQLALTKQQAKAMILVLSGQKQLSDIT